jgi:hypothetical protein
LNFGLAAEQAKSEGYKVEVLLVIATSQLRFFARRIIESPL